MQVSSRLPSAILHILQDRITEFILEPLPRHPQGIAVRAHLVLQSRNDRDVRNRLLAAQTVGRADLALQVQDLGTVLVLLDASLLVFVALRLQLGQIAPLDGEFLFRLARGEVSQHARHFSQSLFELANQLAVLALLAFEDLDEGFAECELLGQFGNARVGGAGSCARGTC